MLSDTFLSKEAFTLGLVYGREQDVLLANNVQLIEKGIYSFCSILSENGIIVSRNSNNVSRGVVIDYNEPRIVLDDNKVLIK